MSETMSIKEAVRSSLYDQGVQEVIDGERMEMLTNDLTDLVLSLVKKHEIEKQQRETGVKHVG